jgi:uncharacterized protein (TIGR03437 family)
MKPALLAASALATLSLAHAQPVIDAGGVVNNASYRKAGAPDSGIAQGSLFAVFGEKLGPADLYVVGSWPLGESLAGTSVEVTVGEVTLKAIPVYTSARQVGAVLPSRTPAGEGTVVVRYDGKTSAPASIQIVPSSFGIFTQNSAGHGPANAQQVRADARRPMNSASDPARPGELICLWGTGLGPVSADEAAGPRPGDMGVDLEVLVGDRPAKVVYRGRSGCCAGIDEVYFHVPEGVQGCAAPLVVRTGERTSNIATLAVAGERGGCGDPSGRRP